MTSLKELAIGAMCDASVEGRDTSVLKNDFETCLFNNLVQNEIKARRRRVLDPWTTQKLYLNRVYPGMSVDLVKRQFLRPSVGVIIPDGIGMSEGKIKEIYYYFGLGSEARDMKVLIGRGLIDKKEHPDYFAEYPNFRFVTFKGIKLDIHREDKGVYQIELPFTKERFIRGADDAWRECESLVEALQGFSPLTA